MVKLIAMVVVLHGVIVHLTGNPCDLLELSPPSVIVPFSGSFSVNCSTPSSYSKYPSWEFPVGTVKEKDAKYAFWEVRGMTEWSISPICYVPDTLCTKAPLIIVYKMPTSVSINPSRHATMEEGLHYKLQCDVTDIAPAGNFTVNWYIGNELIWSDSFDDPSSEPLNKSSTLAISAKRDYNGAQVFCVAQLNLTSHTAHYSAMKFSEKYEMIVNYLPTFPNPDPETVDLAMGDDIFLNCTAMGNPTPSYSWQSTPPIAEKSKEGAVVSCSSLHPGTYNCTASNVIGTATRHFIVIKTPRGRTTFWAILGPGVIVAILLAVITVYKSIKNNGI